MPIIADFTRPPTAKERPRFEKRVLRLASPEQQERIDRIYRSMPGNLPATGLAIRTGFSFRQEGIAKDASDRSAPPVQQRPPATRLMDGRSAALRFALTLLGLVQARRKPGAKARLNELGIKVVGDSRTLGWTDFIATDAIDANRGGVLLTARDKRARSLRNALIALSDAGLVSIAGQPGARNRFENFVLLDERGVDAVGESEEYTVPRRGESTFVMPAGFLTNGWVHVLEDSEIALLLMLACHEGGWYENGFLVIPPEVRLRHYGLHRDAYSSARKTLEWFGLLKVDEVRRHGDGRAENAELRVHRLRLRSSGFDEPAAQTVVHELSIQVARR